MVELYYALKGAIIGFLVAAPVGPVSILCIRRSLNRGHIAGFATGIGATLGDLVYACIAAFGLTFVINFLREEEFWFRLIGGGFLTAMGLYVFFKKKPPKEPDIEKDASKDAGELLGSAFLVDISNPIIILAYLAIFSGFGIATAEHGVFSAISLVIGVVIGAATWWFILVQIICLFRKKINERGIQLISKSASFLLTLFGILVIISSFIAIPFLKGEF